MARLFDTNILIELIENNTNAISRVLEIGGAPIISVVSRVELEGGVERLGNAPNARNRLDALLDAAQLLDFTAAEAAVYGEIIAAIGFSRRRILDRMIAAQAIVHGATLVTMNGDDFADIPGLALERW